jgi:hypothetical protein
MWTVVVRLVWGRIVLPHRDGVVWCFVDRLEEWEIRPWEYLQRRKHTLFRLFNRC